MTYHAMRAGLTLQQARSLPVGMVQDLIAVYLCADHGWIPRRPKIVGVSLFEQMQGYYG